MATEIPQTRRVIGLNGLARHVGQMVTLFGVSGYGTVCGALYVNRRHDGSPRYAIAIDPLGESRLVSVEPEQTIGIVPAKATSDGIRHYKIRY